MNIPNSHYFKSCISINMHALCFRVDFLEEGKAQYNILYWNLNAVNAH